ncbi:hypothetical protein CPLU01_06469 [Colletotrichum plurivorum]|uniref:Ricin-type beta-trefoil lectin domain-containing protein n=1 Tax=Colletotrichum plurivorum TaxID=2175906 RepID=A0A8H6KI82_9PEZI|nr:hypothetical protein CPLU01_06469 [Colletotrichum plurivorum]
MISKVSIALAFAAALASATPVLHRRVVTELNEEAFKEAQQRDATATRAFSDVQIKTADGRCLFVDELSGDFRANLTPIQVAQCGTKAGEGWDVITAGEHNDQPGSMLVVSTLTQACFNFDPRRQAGNQVLLFSCGGRADGEGKVVNSQLFAFGGGAGPLSFQPENAEGKCLAVKGAALDIADCSAGDASQSFTFGGSGGNGNGNGNGNANPGTGAENGAQQPAAPSTATPAATQAPEDDDGCSSGEDTVTMTFTATVNPGNNAQAPSATAKPETTAPAAAAPTAPAAGNGGAAGGGNGNGNGGNIPAANPTTPVPVSRAGGTLNPTAAAEANAFDATATREFTKAAIRAPNGQCLSIDPTAGDFRQNLIPVALAACDANSPNQQFDVITKGKHNDGKDGAALVVSSLTNGCVSTDGRRADGDTVTLFSCGGRAAGEGGTNTGQLVKISGSSFVWTPVNDAKTCVVPGQQGRLVTAACKGDGSESFTIESLGV